MFKGFKDFLLRGNVVDLAVAVVVGAAFTAIVTAFTSNIIDPLIASIGASDELGWGVQLREGNAATFVDFGGVVTAAINFVIIAAVVYFVLILPVNTAKARFAAKPEASLSDQDILIQIRDLLAEGKSDGVVTGPDGVTGNSTDGGSTGAHAK